MRSYREFILSKKAQREKATQLQNKGQDTKQLDQEVAQQDEEMEEKKEENKEKPVTEKRTKTEHKETSTDQKDKKRREEAALHNIEHDMRDQALGQMSGIPGANIDYDELNKMAKNKIRDASELASESLLNDGYNIENGEIEHIMTGYLREGKGLEQINCLNENYSAEAIARAYIEVAKNSSMRDTVRLEKISEICNFEHPAYEKIFDRLQLHDPETEEVLNKLDMAFGKERS